MADLPTCNAERGCGVVAAFAVFAQGYQFSMAYACRDHLGRFLLRDCANPGSTEEWIVRFLRPKVTPADREVRP